MHVANGEFGTTACIDATPERLKARRPNPFRRGALSVLAICLLDPEPMISGRFGCLVAEQFGGHRAFLVGWNDKHVDE
jgi:hypothetical protein